MKRAGTIIGKSSAGLKASAGLAAACTLIALAGTPAQAGCTRAIINHSALTAVVSRDGGPRVSIPPHRSQAIRFDHPGQIDVALVCARTALGEPAPEATVYRATFSYFAKIDRCYIEIGDNFVEDYFGGGTFGFVNSKPLTFNNPRQGDVIVGPRLEERCPALLRDTVRSRY